MRHHIELLYPGTDSVSGGNRLLALAVIPVSGNIVDAFIRREAATAFGGDIAYDVRIGANASSLATIYGTPADAPTIPFGTLAGTSDPAAYPVAVTAGQTIGFYRTSAVAGGAGSRPTIVIVVEDGDPAVQGAGATVAGNLAAFTNSSANEIEDAAVAVSIDGTFASDSDNLVPTEKAVKTYVDLAVTVPRADDIASSATPTPDADAQDVFIITALAVNAVIAAPTGTPVEGQALMIRIKDNGTGRTLGFNAIYRAIGVTLPTTTVATKTLYLGMIYNAVAAKWDVLGVAQEA